MPGQHPEQLVSLVSARSGRPVDDDVASIADAVRAAVGDAACAVLAYGSCLRGVSTEDSLVDLYVLVDAYGRMREAAALRVLNRLIPPNVYYAECRHGDRTIRAKYAVISLDQFVRRVSPATRNPYFWARFSQPTAIVFTTDVGVRARVIDALCTAATTMVEEARALSGGSADPARLWTSVLVATYGTEFRSEGPTRAREIYAADREHYDALAAAVPEHPGWAGGSWPIRRIEGKLLSVARLIKAAFTFSGGSDYLAWKIERHSGVRVELTPWQRRHPILAAMVLFPRLYASGGFR